MKEVKIVYISSLLVCFQQIVASNISQFGVIRNDNNMRGSNHFGPNYKMFESQANSIYPVSFCFIKCIFVKFELLFHFSQLSKSKNKKCIQLNPFYSKCNFEKMTNIWFFFSFSKLFASILASWLENLEIHFLNFRWNYGIV